MKKFLLLTFTVAVFTGCGRGWLPLHRGAPCNGCAAPTLPASIGCNDCAGGVQRGYASYDGIVDGQTYYEGAIYDGNAPMVAAPTN